MRPANFFAENFEAGIYGVSERRRTRIIATPSRRRFAKGASPWDGGTEGRRGRGAGGQRGRGQRDGETFAYAPSFKRSPSLCSLVGNLFLSRLSPRPVGRAAGLTAPRWRRAADRRSDRRSDRARKDRAPDLRGGC